MLSQRHHNRAHSALVQHAGGGFGVGHSGQARRFPFIGCQDIDQCKERMRQGHRGRGIQDCEQAVGLGDCEGFLYGGQWNLELGEQHGALRDRWGSLLNVLDTERLVAPWCDGNQIPAGLVHHDQRRACGTLIMHE